MAHALYNYDGLCKNVHGHSYNLEITLLGKIRKEPGHPKDGMVIDFGNLKKLVKSNIVNVFDHSLVVSSLFPKEHIESMKNATERLIVLDFQPTSENLVVYFAEKLQQVLPSNVSLFSIRLYETATSYVEWFAADNA